MLLSEGGWESPLCTEHPAQYLALCKAQLVTSIMVTKPGGLSYSLDSQTPQNILWP